MPGISNMIERFLKEMFEGVDNGIIEIQRNELAEKFQCSPSQINYVLTTRFTPYKGYYIESRRGGGGYIKIMKVCINEFEDINHIIVSTIGEAITKSKAYHIIEGLIEEKIISIREGNIIKVAMGDGTLSKVDPSTRNELRADLLKNILLVFSK